MSALTLSKENRVPSVLLIFIHGFKGTDETFGEFPTRLRHVLAQSLDNVIVESILFPAYETKGDLNSAVIRFADWLTTLTVQRENEHGTGAGSVKIILCGHSMGGFLAADSLLEFLKTRPDQKAPLWPNIIACLTFDTPFLGIHPFVVKHSMTKVADYANAAKTVGSVVFGSFAALGAKRSVETASTPTNASTNTSWGKWAPAAYAVGGALLAGAAAGGAYYKRDDLTQGYSWATDHLKYVGNLWDESALKRRLEGLVNADEQHGVVFRNFYAYLPEAPPMYLISRTFIVLPKRTSPEWKHFSMARNGLALDEIQGHVGMFSAKTNDGYYALGLEAANVIRRALHMTGETLEIAKAEEIRQDNQTTP